MKLDARLIKKIDYKLILVVLMLCCFGLVIISSATATMGSEGFIKTQVISMVLGMISIVIILFFDYHTFARFHIPIYLLCNGLLFAVIAFGAGAESWGASRWIRIGGFQFQPVDFVKIGMIICIARMIVENKDQINQPLTLLKILAYAGVPMALIYKQPDLGTTLAFAFFIFGMLFVAGLNYKYIIGTAIFGIIALPVAWMTGILYDHQKQRILTFLNPSLDPKGDGYQILQSKMAVGSGMLFGKGLYQGTQTQFGFLPEKQTDFIFSVVAEETGFIGVMILLALFFFLLFRCIRIAREAKDDYGMILVTGFTFLLAFHIFANIAMTIGLMPVTGKPLPFISYGGTFMLSNMIAIGFILNVNMRRDKINF